MRKFLLAFDRRLSGFASLLSQVLLALCVLAGAYQVAARFIFNNPSDWTEVLTRFMLIWMVYVGTAVALRQGALVSVDALRSYLTGRSRRGLEALITGAVVLFMGILLYYGCDIAYRIRFQNVASLDISMSWAYLAIPVGAFCSIVAVLANYFDRQHQELENAV